MNLPSQPLNSPLRARVVELREGAEVLRMTSSETRTSMLRLLQSALLERSEEILAANKRELSEFGMGLESSLLQRLHLTPAKISGLAEGLQELANSEDPIGKIQRRLQLSDGLVLDRVTVPLGVCGVIFESRPDAFIQVLGLALRTGNGIVLKGGREATHTIRAMAEIVSSAMESAGYPSKWFLSVEGRDAVEELLKFDDLIDLMIPRGSNEFVRYIQEHSRIPVLGHAAGVCHIYIHPSADLAQTLTLIVDAKTQYPAACNAVETLLIDRAAVSAFLVPILTTFKEHGVLVRGCPKVVAVDTSVELVPENDWSHEYSALAVSIKVVPDMHAAITHINRFGSHHTDAILCQESAVSEYFLDAVDSASVLVNCSTRFADGYRYGLGAEVGIATGKLHARGPVGAEGLLTYKYKLRGQGHRVEDFVEGRRNFDFIPLDSEKAL